MLDCTICKMAAKQKLRNVHVSFHSRMLFMVAFITGLALKNMVE